MSYPDAYLGDQGELSEKFRAANHGPELKMANVAAATWPPTLVRSLEDAGG